MNKLLSRYPIIILVFSWMFISLTTNAQTIIRGTVINQNTQTPLPYVSVYFNGGKGVTTGVDGRYQIVTNNLKLTELVFSSVGMVTVSKKIKPGLDTVIDIAMNQAALKEVVIKAKRGKYSNKNNPAVELIKQVIDHKDSNRNNSYAYLQYQQYEKMELSLTNKPEKILNNKLFKNFAFIVDNQDTTKLQGKALVPVYMQEKLTDYYYRKQPEKTQSFLKGEKKVNFGEFVDNNGISTYLNRLYADIDVYDNNISILTNQFLSPIAASAPTFYRFYIRDTVERDGIQLVQLYFTPRNPNDLLFRGTLFVTLDGRYAVQQLTMTVSKNANLNWTRSLHIKQSFQKGVDGRYHVSFSNMMAEFALSKNADGGLLGERTVSYKDFVINQPASDSIYKAKIDLFDESPARVTDSFWVVNRHQPLTATEAKVYSNIDSLQKMKSYRRFMDIATLLLAGYKSFGPFEMGPVNAFYSFNPVEGFRLRAGGRTTPHFSKRIYLENYLAYGFKDQKLKYFLSTAYSLNKKSIYTYPLNYVKVSYQYDTKIPGQELQFVQEDNFLLSFKRGDNNKFLYNRIFKAEYVREFAQHLSYNFGFKHWQQSPAGALSFEKIINNQSSNIEKITTAELSAEIRWAPHEEFYQGKVYRIPIFNKYPIVTFRYTAGIKGLLNSEYNYHNFNLNVFKRTYFSQFGYADMSLEGGYIIGKLPFPLLSIHRANQTYAYQLYSFNLMNAMEFISDHYASLNVDYYLNGFLFNKIPGLKRIKLREVMSAKVLYGGVRSENNPATQASALQFPKDNLTGTPTSFALTGKPYIEVSAGIANIFKLVRVDLVKRLTYLDNPGISTWGIRTRVKFDF